MKNTLSLTFLLFTATLWGNPYEDCYYEPCCETCQDSRWLFDANIGYFYPFSKDLRDVVSGGANYQLQATYQWNKCFGAFISGDFFYKSGRSTGSHSGTNIWILPLTIGLRASMDLWKSCDGSRILQGYCLLGPRWYFVRTHNSSDYINHRNNAQGIGGVGGFGLSYLLDHFTLNAFTNFSFGNVHARSCRKNISAPNTQVGGIVAGGGVGWNF